MYIYIHLRSYMWLLYKCMCKALRLACFGQHVGG